MMMTRNQHKEVDHNNKTDLLSGTKLHIDPDEDVAGLFQNFNRRFFWGKLKYVEVRWSPRMTLCAGLCVYKPKPGYCSIRLSRPLLTLRGKIDLVETLLHEMIHAYLFVTENNRDRDGHGPEFLKHMDRINKEVGLNISVYHTFSKEVRHYQQHVWICNGPCQTRPPYFGKVCRAMNRAPGPTDYWWSDHLQSCGGTYSKISEPEGYEPPKKREFQGKRKKSQVKDNMDIRTFFKPSNEESSLCDTSASSSHNQIAMSDVSEDRIQGQVQSEPNTSGEVVCSSSDETETDNDEPNTSGDVVCSSSDETETDNDDSMSDTSSCDLGIFDTNFKMPLSRFLKRGSQDSIDPQSVKIRKPDFNALSNSKRGGLKNAITVPDQPTLNMFYSKKKSFATKNSFIEAKISVPKVNDGIKKKRLNQPSLKTFFKIN